MSIRYKEGKLPKCPCFFKDECTFKNSFGGGFSALFSNQGSGVYGENHLRFLFQLPGQHEMGKGLITYKFTIYLK